MTFEEMGNVVDLARERLKENEALIKALYFAIVDARDFADQYVDVIDGEELRPNRAMSLCSEWDWLIHRTERALGVTTNA